MLKKSISSKVLDACLIIVGTNYELNKLSAAVDPYCTSRRFRKVQSECSAVLTIKDRFGWLPSALKWSPCTGLGNSQNSCYV